MMKSESEYRKGRKNVGPFSTNTAKANRARLSCIGAFFLLVATLGLHAQEADCNLTIENRRSDTIVMFVVDKQTGKEFAVARIYGQADGGEAQPPALIGQGDWLRFKSGCDITENGMKIAGGTVVHQFVVPNVSEAKIILTGEMKQETVKPFPGQ